MSLGTSCLAVNPLKDFLARLNLEGNHKYFRDFLAVKQIHHMQACLSVFSAHQSNFLSVFLSIKHIVREEIGVAYFVFTCCAYPTNIIL